MANRRSATEFISRLSMEKSIINNDDDDNNNSEEENEEEEEKEEDCIDEFSRDSIRRRKALASSGPSFLSFFIIGISFVIFLLALTAQIGIHRTLPPSRPQSQTAPNNIPITVLQSNNDQQYYSNNNNNNNNYYNNNNHQANAPSRSAVFRLMDDPIVDSSSTGTIETTTPDPSATTTTIPDTTTTSADTTIASTTTTTTAAVTTTTTSVPTNLTTTAAATTTAPISNTTVAPAPATLSPEVLACIAKCPNPPADIPPSDVMILWGQTKKAWGSKNYGWYSCAWPCLNGDIQIRSNETTAVDRAKLRCNLQNQWTDWTFRVAKTSPPICIVVGLQNGITDPNSDFKMIARPLVDDFTMLQLSGSSNRTDLMHCSTRIAVEINGVTSGPKSRFGATDDGSCVFVVPFWTIVIELKNGVIQSITWDDECGSCSSKEDGNKCVDGNCGELFDNCIPNGNVNCDIKIYIAWKGTDSNGNYLISSSRRFSQFRRFSLSSAFTAATDFSGQDLPQLPSDEGLPQESYKGRG